MTVQGTPEQTTTDEGAMAAAATSPRETSPPAVPGPVSRRGFLRVAGLGVGAAALGSPLLAACHSIGGTSGGGGAAGGAGKTIKIGFVSPRTGPASGFGEPDGYVLGLARAALADGLTVGGTRYSVQVIDKDGQSDPQRSGQVANDLITSAGVDLMLTTSTPETVNPVSDACEAAGIPCISTVVPWQAWYFGRGAKPTEKHAYAYTYHFCFGVETFDAAYQAMWPQVATNRTVGVLYPNDSDGNAVRGALAPLLTKAGYRIVDPGAYADGTNDYSSQIAQFKRKDCQIFNTFPIPSDFATFWQQAAQQGYRPKIAQTAKTGLFPSQVEALGPIGINLAGAAYWTPTFPYTSSLTGVSSADLATGYQKHAGKQWTQQLGASLALFDAAAAALKASSDPKDRKGVAAAIGKLKVTTPVGELDWTSGPVANVAKAPIIGGQWVKASGGRYPLDFVLCEHAADPRVPIAAKLVPYS